MGKFIISLLLALCACHSGGACGDGSDTSETVMHASVGDSAVVVKEDPVPDGVGALLAAYPDVIRGYRNNYIFFVDGDSLLYDDGKEKTFQQMLDSSDPEDMFGMIYDDSKAPDYLADAGRSRCEALFKKMYGANASQVQRNLATVDWFGQKISFTRVNGASDALKAVASELSSHPEIGKYLKCSGTFYWRKVRGADRLSAHSYGIAVDIAVDYSDYWLWKNPSKSETDRISYSNRIPKKIVDIFRKHGFIWGGAWYHFDTMHFEYRPEILNYADNYQE